MMPSKTTSVLIGAAVYAVVGALMSFVAFRGGLATMALGGCGACLAAFAGPAVAVWHYVTAHRLTLPAGSGAGLGAVTGLVGAVASTALAFALRAASVLPTPAEAADIQRRLLAEAGFDAAQVDAQVQSGQAMSGPIAEFAIALVAGLVIGAIGGAIAAAVVKRGEDYEV